MKIKFKNTLVFLVGLGLSFLVAGILYKVKLTDSKNGKSLTRYVKRYTKSDKFIINQYFSEELLKFLNFQPNINQKFLRLMFASRNHKRQFTKFCVNYEAKPSSQEVKDFYYANQDLFARRHPIEVTYVTDNVFKQNIAVSKDEVQNYIKKMFAEKLRVYHIYQIPYNNKLDKIKADDILSKPEYKKYKTKISSLDKHYEFLKSLKLNRPKLVNIHDKQYFVLLFDVTANLQLQNKVFLNNVKRDIREFKKANLLKTIFEKVLHANRNKLTLHDLTSDLKVSEKKLRTASVQPNEKLFIYGLSDDLLKALNQSILQPTNNEMSKIFVSEDPVGNFIIFSYIHKEGQYIDFDLEYEKVLTIFKEEKTKVFAEQFKNYLETQDERLNNLKLHTTQHFALFENDIFQDRLLTEVFSTQIEGFTNPVVDINYRVCVGFVNSISQGEEDVKKLLNISTEFKSSMRHSVINGMQFNYENR